MASSNMNNKHFEVLIVGAGISGLIAAKRLVSRGILNVGIVEARDRLGGRIHVLERGDDFLDLGAHVVHGTTGNAVYEFARRLGVTVPPEELPDKNYYILARNAQLFDSRLAVKFETAFDTLFCQFGNDKKFADLNLSVGDIFNAVKLQLLADSTFANIPMQTKEDLLNQFVKVQCLDLGVAEPHEVTAAGEYAWLACEPPHSNNLQDGYSSVLAMILESLVILDIQLNGVVNKIVWSDAGCLVHYHQPTEDVTVSANRVICTIPLGCLKEDTVTFVPPLPNQKLVAIKKIGMGLVDRIILQFDVKWWTDDFNQFFIVWPQETDGESDLAIRKCLDPTLYQHPNEMNWYREIHTFGTEWSPSSGHYLSTLASGKWASVIERLPDEEILCVLSAIITFFLAPHFSNVQVPTKIIRSKWQMDPFARGSYTAIRVDSSPEMLDIMAEPLPSSDNPRVLFAGEATHSHFFSTVHGAWESGEREADRILDTLEARSRTSSVSDQMKNEP